MRLSKVEILAQKVGAYSGKGAYSSLGAYSRWYSILHVKHRINKVFIFCEFCYDGMERLHNSGITNETLIFEHYEKCFLQIA